MDKFQIIAILHFSMIVLVGLMAIAIGVNKYLKSEIIPAHKHAEKEITDKLIDKIMWAKKVSRILDKATKIIGVIVFFLFLFIELIIKPAF